MAENKFPKKDSKGNDITPHITKAIVETEEQKDSTLKKAAKVFFSEDIDHVTDSIVDDFIKPRATSFGMDLVKKVKEFLFDSITDFAGSIFFGNRPSGGNTYNRGGSSYTSYSNYGKKYSSGYNYNSYGNEPDDYYWYNGNYYRNNQPPETVRHDIVRERAIPDAGKAQAVLDELRFVIRTTKDQFVSVADYYVAVGVKPNEINALDYEYGWTGSMLDKCRPNYTRRGYILNLPRPIPKP